MDVKNFDFGAIKPFSGAPDEQKDTQTQMLSSGMTLQKTGTQYTTAIKVQEARNLDRVVSNVLKEAEYAGEDFYYYWLVLLSPSPKS